MVQLLSATCTCTLTVSRLAPLVVLTLLVAVATLAEVTSCRVFTHLDAHARRLPALVDVATRATVVAQREPLVTRAVEAGQGVDALVLARTRSRRLRLAFVYNYKKTKYPI